MGKVGSSPAFRRNGRQNPHPPKPEDADTPADISDLEAMDTAALKLHLEREALLVTAQIMRKPLRNAQAVLGAARDLGTYCITKPVQKTETDFKAQLAGTIQIELVAAKDGREVGIDDASS